MSPGAAAASPSDETDKAIFSMYAVGLVAVQVVNPTRVEPGLTSTLISAGAHVIDTAAVGNCACAGTATSNIEARYRVKTQSVLLTPDIVLTNSSHYIDPHNHFAGKCMIASRIKNKKSGPEGI